jgi:hypothetical protein
METERCVVVGVQDSAKGRSIGILRPADLPAFQLPDIIGIERKVPAPFPS